MRFPVSVTDVMRNFSDYVNRVAYRGESFTLVRGGKPVAELSPVPTGRRLGELPALLAGLPRLTREEATGFLDELEEARCEVDGLAPGDPWES